MHYIKQFALTFYRTEIFSIKLNEVRSGVPGCLVRFCSSFNEWVLLK